MTAIIAHGGSQASGVGSPPTIILNTTGADRIFVASTDARSVGVPTFTDSFGNAYTALTQYSNLSSGGPAIRIFYSQDAPTVGSGHNFTSAPTHTNSAIAVLAISGSVSNPFDAGTDQGNASNTLTVQPSASITPSVNNCIVICAAAEGGIGTRPSIDSGFSASDNMSSDDSFDNAYGLGLFYLIQTTAAAVQPIVTYPADGRSPILAIAIAAFKATAAGGAAPRSRGFIFGCNARRPTQRSLYAPPARAVLWPDGKARSPGWHARRRCADRRDGSL